MSAITSPSELNKRITFQRPVKAPDGMGGFVTTWTTAATVWAAIWPMSASETIKAAQTGMTITHRIRIRYRDGLKASWRVSWGGKYLNIVSIINPSSSNRWLDLLVKEAAS